MSVPKKKALKKDLDEQDSRPMSIDALAELTNSDVIEQVKNGLSRIAPLKMDEESIEGFDY